MIPAKMRALAEAELAKMYRQWARGRAIVQTNCMQEARTLKTIVDSGKRYGIQLSRAELSIARNRMIYTVRRAREACRDWRKYRRQMHDSIKEGL